MDTILDKKVYVYELIIDEPENYDILYSYDPNHKSRHNQSNFINNHPFLDGIPYINLDLIDQSHGPKHGTCIGVNTKFLDDCNLKYMVTECRKYSLSEIIIGLIKHDIQSPKIRRACELITRIPIGSDFKLKVMEHNPLKTSSGNFTPQQERLDYLLNQLPKQLYFDGEKITKISPYNITDCKIQKINNIVIYSKSKVGFVSNTDSVEVMKMGI